MNFDLEALRAEARARPGVVNSRELFRALEARPTSLLADRLESKRVKERLRNPTPRNVRGCQTVLRRQLLEVLEGGPRLRRELLGEVEREVETSDKSIEKTLIRMRALRWVESLRLDAGDTALTWRLTNEGRATLHAWRAQ